MENFPTAGGMTYKQKYPTNVNIENYNKIESALNNYDPTPLVSSLVGSTFVEINDSD